MLLQAPHQTVMNSTINGFLPSRWSRPCRVHVQKKSTDQVQYQQAVALACRQLRAARYKSKLQYKWAMRCGKGWFVVLTYCMLTSIDGHVLLAEHGPSRFLSRALCAPFKTLL